MISLLHCTNYKYIHAQMCFIKQPLGLVMFFPVKGRQLKEHVYISIHFFNDNSMY